MNRISTPGYPGRPQFPSDTRPGAFTVRLPYPKERRELERRDNAKRRELCDAKDSIDQQREELIGRIEKQLKHTYNAKTLNEDSFWNKDTAREIRVEAVFSDLTNKENESLGGYLKPDGTFHMARSARIGDGDGDPDGDADNGEDKIVSTNSSFAIDRYRRLFGSRVDINMNFEGVEALVDRVMPEAEYPEALNRIRKALSGT